jgi:hypothetical protein
VKALRVALLRRHMTPISRIAHVALPDTQELLPLRAPGGDPSTEHLVAAARAMATVAAEHAGVFITAGLPADFVPQLRSAADAVLHAKDARTRTRGTTNGATTNLKARLREARQSVHILDGLVRKELVDQPGLLRDWSDSKRLPRARKSSVTAAPGTTVGSIAPASPATPATPTPTVTVAQAA